MPSTSLLEWQTDQMPRLNKVDIQCAACLRLAPPNPKLFEENLRGYVLLLSAHFQRFCRDLHTECAQIIASKIRASLRLLVQEQFSAKRMLDRGNPTYENLREDFERFGFNLDLAAADPTNALRMVDLADLNKWRNVAAHHAVIPSGLAALNLPLLQKWRISCDALATSLDQIMYNELRKRLRRAPW